MNPSILLPTTQEFAILIQIPVLECNSTSARNYSTHATRVTFDDDDIIELANYLTDVKFSHSDQEPTLHWQPEYGFSLRSPKGMLQLRCPRYPLNSIARSKLPFQWLWLSLTLRLANASKRSRIMSSILPRLTNLALLLLNTNMRRLHLTRHLLPFLFHPRQSLLLRLAAPWVGRSDFRPLTPSRERRATSMIGSFNWNCSSSRLLESSPLRWTLFALQSLFYVVPPLPGGEVLIPS